jgi:hypothetical protein
MDYSITKLEQKEDTIFTTVLFVSGDTKLELVIPHFRPTSKEEVITGIENRVTSEQNKLNATEITKQVVIDLEKLTGLTQA